MPAGSLEATLGLTIAGAVIALALLFAWRQWAEMRGRDRESLSAEDRDYFAGKDRRRFAGSIVMALIAAGMFAGLAINPRAGKAAGEAFVWIWAGVTVLVGVSLALAMKDWWANADYARRHHRAILEARQAYLEGEIRRRRGPGDGTSGTHEPLAGP